MEEEEDVGVLVVGGSVFSLRSSPLNTNQKTLKLSPEAKFT
jgi:hypothetical protein